MPGPVNQRLVRCPTFFPLTQRNASHAGRRWLLSAGPSQDSTHEREFTSSQGRKVRTSDVREVDSGDGEEGRVYQVMVRERGERERERERRPCVMCSVLGAADG